MMISVSTATAALQSALIDEIEAWCKEQGLEWESADEMLFNADLTRAQRIWLTEFIEAWEAWEVLGCYEHSGDERR